MKNNLNVDNSSPERYLIQTFCMAIPVQEKSLFCMIHLFFKTDFSATFKANCSLHIRKGGLLKLNCERLASLNEFHVLFPLI